VCLSQARYKTKSKKGYTGREPTKVSFFRIIKCRIKACQWATKWSIAKHSNIYYQLVNRTFSALPTGWPKKFGTLCTIYNFIKYWPIFKLLFTLRRRKFVIILSLKIPPHLKCFATLQCDISVLTATTENKSPVTTHFKSASSSSKADTLNILM